jgi:hypothetical protein
MAVPTYTREQLLNLISTKLAGSPNTIHATEHRDLETAIVNAIYGQEGDIKEIAANDAYILANFDMTAPAPGLGLANGERYGWAICNGNNGTINKMGKVAIGYDPVNYTLGTIAGSNTGGEKTHILTKSEMPIHNHTPNQGTGFNANTSFYQTANIPESQGYQIGGSFDDANGHFKRSATTGDTGGGLAHNNMQPYIVTLFIQRIPMP